MKLAHLLLIAQTMAGALGASDWPAWRGPSADGSAASGDYPTRWTRETVAWTFELPGKGGSTPIVWQDRIYLTTPADGRNAVLALDRAGNRRWLTAFGPASAPRHRTLGTSCNASPVTDGQGLFVRFRSGTFAALELDGTVRWQMDLTERFGPESYFWDQGTSPIVTERDVIYARMHHGDSWVAAFDKATGELRWQTKRNFDVPNENDNAYTTPLLFRHRDQLACLVWGADHLTAYSTADGRLLWSCGRFNPEGTGNWPAIASPVLHDNIVVVPVGRDDRRQGRLAGVRVDGTGDVSATHRVWTRTDFGIFCCTPVLWRDRVYLLRPLGQIACIEPGTGRTLWEDALPPGGKHRYYASPVIASGILYAARDDGAVFVARVADRMQLLEEIPMGERIIASPVPVDGRLLLRGDAHLFCVGAGAAQETGVKR